MALITCKECGQSISDKAASCPKCGAPLSPEQEISTPEKEKKNKNKWLIPLIVLLILLFVGGGVLGYNYYKQKEETEKLKREKFLQDSIMQSRNDSLMRIQLLEKQREDSIKITRELIVSCYTMKLGELNRMVAHKYGEDASLKYYFLFDITKDGVPELWTKYGSCEADYELHVFSYDNGKAREIYSAGAGHTSYYQGSDYILAFLAHMGYVVIIKLTYDGKSIRERTILEKDCRMDEDYPDVKEPDVATFDFENTQVLSQLIK